VSTADGIAGMVNQFDALAQDAALWELWLSQHAARTHALIEAEKLLPMSLLGDPSAWRWQQLWSDDGVVAPCAWRERKEPHCRCARCKHQKKELLELRSGPCDCGEREAKQRAKRAAIAEETRRSVRDWWATTQDLDGMRRWLAIPNNVNHAGGPDGSLWAHADDLAELEAWDKCLRESKAGGIPYEEIRALKIRALGGSHERRYCQAPAVHHARIELAAWARSADELRSMMPDPGLDWVDPERVPRDAVLACDAAQPITAAWWMRAKSDDDLRREAEELRAANALQAEKNREWKRKQDEQKRREERRKQREMESDDGEH